MKEMVVKNDTLRMTEEQRELVDQNMGLFFSYFERIKAKYNIRERDIPDLISIMHDCICRSSMKYDPSIGKFSTYVYGGFYFAFFTLRSKLKKANREPFNLTDVSPIFQNEPDLDTVKIRNDMFNHHLKIDIEPLLKIIDESKLTYREETVLKGRFLQDLTYSEIGRRLCLTHQRIQQILWVALWKVRTVIIERKHSFQDFVI